MPDPDATALRTDPRVLWNEDVLRFSDTDQNGHINNTAFSVFCESGRVNFLRRVITPAEIPGRYFVLATITIDYRAELLFPGAVRCGTWLDGLGASSVRFGQALLDGSDRIVALARAVTVGMDRQTRRPAPLTASAREAAACYVRAEAGAG